ncbi:TonB C-terminal domain-containing protein [Porticoccaceae bacterium]|nr:TonB C-terminal domain-containing protein [Porticoccaceae bacterium]
MKRLLLTLLLISPASFAGWGDTEGNKSSDNARVAAVTCAVISESKPWQAAFRVERVNQAREKLGLKAYLDGDKKLMRAIANDTCGRLVLDDPKYQDIPAGSKGFTPYDNDTYADFSRQIIDEILIHWKSPQTSNDTLETIVNVRLVPTGRIVGVNIIKSSGNNSFDKRIEMTLFKVEQFKSLSSMDSKMFEESFRSLQLRFSSDNRMSIIRQ